MALLMTIISAACWGSWANTFKVTRGYRFELFYWDYALGICLIALVLALTMGSVHPDGMDFVSNLHSADRANFYYAIVAGAIFNVANVLLVAGIDMAGLAVAFPLSIGIALAVGVVLSYLQNPKGNALLLGIAVACAIVAVIFDGRAYRYLNAGRSGSAGGRTSRKSVLVCVISGVLMGLFAPIVSHALNTGHPLTPYTVGVFFNPGRAGLLLRVQRISDASAAGGRPSQRQRLFSHQRGQSLAGSARGLYLGTGYGVQFCRLQSHGGGDLLRHRSVGTHGRRPVGRVRMARVPRCRYGGASEPGAHVPVLHRRHALVSLAYSTGG